MKHTLPSRARGATLLVAMIVLVVLTLLVVYAVRMGNTNLRIAGNMQARTEASAVAEQAIEKAIETIIDTSNISGLTIAPTTVTVNNEVYNVTVAPLNSCLLEVPVLNSELDPANASDVACFENQDADKAITATGELSNTPSACKTQNWEIQADVVGQKTQAKVTHVQGVQIRVAATVDCL